MSGKDRNARREFSFIVNVTVHEFPTPSKPIGLLMYSRTRTALICKWQHPEHWGGCALSRYELQMQERAQIDQTDLMDRYRCMPIADRAHILTEDRSCLFARATRDG